MKIPSSFNLQGHEIKIIFDTETCKEKGFLGFADYCQNSIILSEEANDKKLHPTVIDHCLIHEVVHFILNALGEERLNLNEKFVDGFAGHLHQILQTLKYENQD